MSWLIEPNGNAWESLLFILSERSRESRRVSAWKEHRKRWKYSLGRTISSYASISTTHAEKKSPGLLKSYVDHVSDGLSGVVSVFGYLLGAEKEVSRGNREHANNGPITFATFCEKNVFDTLRKSAPTVIFDQIEQPKPKKKIHREAIKIFYGYEKCGKPIFYGNEVVLKGDDKGGPAYYYFDGHCSYLTVDEPFVMKTY